MLFLKKVMVCGTIILNRVGFPGRLNDIKEWPKREKSGDMIWDRDGDVLGL